MSACASYPVWYGVSDGSSINRPVFRCVWVGGVSMVLWWLMVAYGCVVYASVITLWWLMVAYSGCVYFSVMGVGGIQWLCYGGCGG